jgi:hypothetical protein
MLRPLSPDAQEELIRLMTDLARTIKNRIRKNPSIENERETLWLQCDYRS